MKTLQRHLLAAALLAAMGVGAIAQTTAPAPQPGAGNPPALQGQRDPARMEQFRARMQERMAQRMNAFKQKLAITTAQEGAWTTWSDALKPVRFQRPDRAEFDRLSTPERIDRIRALRAERNAQMDKRLDATKTFYAQLTPEQKKTFDAEGGRFLRGGRHGHRGGFGGEHRHGDRQHGEQGGKRG